MRTRSNRKKSRNLKGNRKALFTTLAANKKRPHTRPHIFKTCFYGCTRMSRKSRHSLKSTELSKKTCNGSKKPFAEFKSLLNAPEFARKPRKGKASITKCAVPKASPLKSHKKFISNLKEKLENLTEHKENNILSRRLRLEGTLRSVDEMYGQYSALAAEALKARQQEAAAFEDYIARSQEEEKKAVDAHLETSHQGMKIKLLRETLAKRSHEHNKVLGKSKELVRLGVTLKKQRLKEKEREVQDLHEASRECEAKLQYTFRLDNSK